MMAEYDIIVLGGGPAGLAATFYSLQAQLNVALVAPSLGGKVSYPFALRGLPAVEAVWGADLTQQFEAHVEAKLKAYFPQEAKQIQPRHGGGFQVMLDDTSLISAQTLIVCTGAHPQRLYVEGEMQYFGRGVSFSAISHAAFFRNRNVAVIGGERALPAVQKLSALAARVYFVIARTDDIKRSHLAEQVLRNPKVFLFQEWEVQGISGDEFVTSLDLVGVNGETRSLPVEGVFVEFGLLPNIELVRDLVALDEYGHIIVNQRNETNVPGLFAAGDVTNVHAEQVPVAIGEGVKAALSAWSYLAMRR
ncbi:MAG: FAD-dependent oxidoreductase [Caldilineaceae bacterium]|nr:FAD-dependent oxidoreductase [Caldilineaceae bacterium]